MAIASQDLNLHHDLMRATPRTSTQTEVLAGLVDRVTFHNSDSGFCVLRVKARGQRDLITIVGHAAMISAGEFIQASGGWINDRTHGVQFRASFLRATAPTTVEGIEKYLGSGMIRGIGPVYAKKLVRAFGETVFDLIEQEPGRLREVTGIGPKRAERIIAGWAEQKVIREIMLFLHSNGVGTSRAVRIYKTYGADAIRLISENPYRLARDIRGIGFRTADQIAAKLGIEKTALIRVRAGISFVLAEAMDDGHCGLPNEELLALTIQLLEVPAELVETALSLELQEGAVIADDLDGRRCIFLAGLYRAEREIAGKLNALAAGKPPWPLIDGDRAIPWVEKRTKLALAESQIQALRVALASKVLVITAARVSARRRWSTQFSRSFSRRPSLSRYVRLPVAPPNACRRVPGSRQRRSTGCSKPTPGPELSGEPRRRRSTANCSLSTRPRWSTCR
jgi:exodeoxyribonuclease V alpha subunit